MNRPIIVNLNVMSEASPEEAQDTARKKVASFKGEDHVVHVPKITEAGSENPLRDIFDSKDVFIASHFLPPDMGEECAEKWITTKDGKNFRKDYQWVFLVQRTLTSQLDHMVALNY